MADGNLNPLEDARSEIGGLGLFLMELGKQAHPSLRYLADNILKAKARELRGAYQGGYESGYENGGPYEQLGLPTNAIEKYKLAGRNEYERDALVNRLGLSRERLGQIRIQKAAADLFDLFGIANPELSPDYTQYYAPGGEEFLPKRVEERRSRDLGRRVQISDILGKHGGRSRGLLEDQADFQKLYQAHPEIFTGPGTIENRQQLMDIRQQKADEESGGIGGRDKMIAKGIAKITTFYSNKIAPLETELRKTLLGTGKALDEFITDDIDTLQRKFYLGQIEPGTKEHRALLLYTEIRNLQNEAALAKKAVADGFATAEELMLGGGVPVYGIDINDPNINPTVKRSESAKQAYFEGNQPQIQQGYQTNPLIGPPNPFPQLEENPGSVDLESLWNEEFGR